MHMLICIYFSVFVSAQVESSAASRMEHRALLEHQIKEKAFKKASADFGKVCVCIYIYIYVYMYVYIYI